MGTSVQFSPDAIVLSRRLVAEIEWPDELTQSILLLRWSAGEKDIIRSKDGKAVWNVATPAGWLCEVASWTDVEGSNIKDHAISIDGLRLLLHPTASQAGGCFFVDVVDGRLSVEHQPT